MPVTLGGSSSGGGGGSGRGYLAFNSVLDMPAFAINSVSWREGSNWRYSSAGQLWDMIDNNGGYADCNGLAADTWETALDVTSGRGILCQILLPQTAANVADTTFDIKVTVDGVAATKQITFDQTNSRYMVIGAQALGASVSDQMLEDTNSNLSNDASVHDLQQGLTLEPPTLWVSQARPVLPFDSSLKVEMRCSQAIVTSAYYRNFGALVSYLPEV